MVALCSPYRSAQGTPTLSITAAVSHAVIPADNGFCWVSGQPLDPGAPGRLPCSRTGSISDSLLYFCCCTAAEAASKIDTGIPDLVGVTGFEPATSSLPLPGCAWW